MRCLKLLFCFAVAGFGAGTSFAHDPGLSRGELRRVGTNLELRLAFHTRDIALALQLPADRALSDAAVRAAWHQQLEAGVVARCREAQRAGIPLHASPSQADQGNGLVTTLVVPAAECRHVEFSEPLLRSLLPGHRQILLVFDAGGTHVATRVLTAGTTAFVAGPELLLTAVAPGAAGWLAMLGAGIHHILVGYDHLAFLLVLLLAVLIQARERAEVGTTTARRLFTVITAFTVAHSVTLGLSATGLVRLPGGPVEALIALSIVIGGLLNLLPRERRLEGAWLPLGFGLIHGFGFAGAFAELAPGDAPVGWLTVAQFNLGVELGQIVAGLPACALGYYVIKRVQAAPRLARYGSAMTAGLGALWFLERTVLA